MPKPGKILSLTFTEDHKLCYRSNCSFVTEEQLDAVVIKILEYEEKAVVAIVRLELRIAEVNREPDTIVIGASVHNFGEDRIDENSRNITE